MSDQAVQRVANSKILRHRAALRHLFLYLAGKTLAGEDADLKEYVIGVEAFAKPPQYDPQTDASVRVQVSRLRQCLYEFYENESPGEAVRIEIPKGQFRLVFKAHDWVPPPAEVAPPVAVLERRVRKMAWAIAAMAAIAVIATLGMVVSATSTTRPSRALTPDLIDIWGSYIYGDRPVLVTLSAPLFTKYTTAETGLFFRDPRLNEWEQAAVASEISRVGTTIGGLHITQSRIYTGVGEATGAFLLSRLLSHASREVSLRRSNGLSLDDFRDRNVIVLGPPKHNAYLNDLPANLPFTFFEGGIRNLRPRPGEPEMFDPKFAPGFENVEEDYALISRFPGLHGVGVTTVLGGSSTEATLAAVEFATQPRYAAQLAARLRDARGKMPPAYQVLLRAKFKSQTPVEINYVTHRLLEAHDRS